MGSLSDLYQQRRELDALIKETEEAAVKAGEYVVIDGERIDSTLNVEGELPAPKKTSYLLTYEKEDGDIVGNAGEISYEDLEANFLQSATEKVNEAVDAGKKAVQNIKTAESDALAAIGENDSSGARGNAISSIDNHVANTSKPAINDYVNNTSKPAIDKYVADTSKPSLDTYTGEKKTELDGYVTSTNKPALDAYTDTKKEEISTLTTTSLQGLQTTLTDALNAIGETDDEGARKAALDAISASLTNALNSIGQSDSTGARGAALTAIAEALSEALASIGTNDTAGARGAAITAIENALNTALVLWQSQVTSDNAALDQKISGANSTIDQKVQEVESDRQEVAQNKSAVTDTKSQIDTIKGDIDTIYGDIKNRQQDVIEKQTAASGSASEAEEAKTAAEQAKTDAFQAKEDAEAAQAAAEKAADDAQSIVGTSLTPDRVLVSNADGKFTASDISTAILSYLSGLTGNVQNQLGGKLGKNEKAQSASSADKLAAARTISISGDASGSGTFDGSNGVTIPVTIKRYNPPGTMLWYFGSVENVPDGYLVCNGSAYSRTAYAALFAVLGTKYGAGDGSTTFNVPDLTDGNGRFIRAGFTDGVIGSKQDDAIRNILGDAQHAGDVGFFAWGGPKASGCFSVGDSVSNKNFQTEGKTTSYKLHFDASLSVATDSENRPYSIYALPLIAY